MNKKLMGLGLTALTLGGLAFGANQAMASNYSEERHQAMTQAFANKDYNAWKDLMSGKGRVSQIVNEGNFARFAEAHQLMLEGKTNEAQTIRAELGLGSGNGYHGGR